MAIESKNATCFHSEILHEKIIQFAKENLSYEKLELMWSELIYFAILGKYECISLTAVKNILNNQPFENCSMHCVDILRQHFVLFQIENKLRFEIIDIDVMIYIYCLLFDIERNKFQFRERNLTLHNGYVTEIQPENIKRSIGFLANVLRRINKFTASTPVESKLDMAAVVFFKIVQIHPFPDGNGRTARMMVNLILRKWNLPYINIPKVRNSSKWFEALKKACNGDHSVIITCFEFWLLERLLQLEKLN